MEATQFEYVKQQIQRWAPDLEPLQKSTLHCLLDNIAYSTPGAKTPPDPKPPRESACSLPGILG